MKILIAGSTGLLGTSLVKTLTLHGYDVIGLSSRGDTEFAVDLRDRFKAGRMLSKHSPDVVINLVALTSVEKCETFPQLSYELNCKVAEILTEWCVTNNKRQIYISTDHIYDDLNPNKESEVKILNNYALAKYAGELASQKGRTTILRTNFVGRSLVSTRESLSDWVYNSCVSNSKVQVLSDVIFSPLSISSLCDVIMEVLTNDSVGIYNVGCKGYMSKAEFDINLGKALGFDCLNMEPIKSCNAAFLTAKRPCGMAMDSSKFESDFDFRLPTIEKIITQVAKEYLV